MCFPVFLASYLCKQSIWYIRTLFICCLFSCWYWYYKKNKVYTGIDSILVSLRWQKQESFYEVGLIASFSWKYCIIINCTLKKSKNNSIFSEIRLILLNIDSLNAYRIKIVSRKMSSVTKQHVTIRKERIFCVNSSLRMTGNWQQSASLHSTRFCIYRRRNVVPWINTTYRFYTERAGSRVHAAFDATGKRLIAIPIRLQWKLFEPPVDSLNR